MQELNLVVTESNQMCGAIVMWSLEGPTKFEALSGAWGTAGLDADDCPSQPSASATLRSVMNTFAKRSRIVRPVNGQFALVEEVVIDQSADIAAGGEPLAHQTLALAKINADDSVSVTARDPLLAADISEEYEKARDYLGVTEFSMWLTTFIQGRMGAVPLRPRGGVYFVPRSGLDVLEKLATVFEATTNHKLYRINALRSEEAVEAILDAVVREANEVVDDVTDEANSGKLTKRSGKSRKEKLLKMTEKLEQYETLLGARRDVMHDRLEQAQANLVCLVLGEDNAE
jgi:hypothetical protein